MTHASSSPESTLRFQDDEDFGYGQLFRILLRRWPWIVGTLGLSIAAAILLASREKPSYLSSMQLIVEPNFEEQLSPSDLNPSNDRRVNEIDYATQLNLMRSEQFVAQAITRLQSEYPMLTVEQVQTGFRLNRVVENDTETRIFKASYIAGDPVLTQRFLEELRAVYLEYNENKQQQRLNRGLDHINEQLMSTRDSLRQSQAALQTFRQNASLIDPSAQAQKAVEALDRIQSEERQLQADFAETQAQYQALEQQLKISPTQRYWLLVSANQSMFRICSMSYKQQNWIWPNVGRFLLMPILRYSYCWSSVRASGNCSRKPLVRLFGNPSATSTPAYFPTYS
jgi:succinoglycan biosynthesis transport protein ExoP